MQVSDELVGQMYQNIPVYQIAPVSIIEVLISH